MKTVTFKISQDGTTVEVDVNGIKGSVCMSKLEPILRTLGKTCDTKKKSEFFVNTCSHRSSQR